MTVDEGVLSDVASSSDFVLYQATGSSPRGLTQRQADERLARWGENVSRREPTPTPLQCLRAGMRSPFVVLLASLGLILGVLGDPRGAVPVAVLASSAVTLRAWQRGRAARALAALSITEPSTATVRRRTGDRTAPKSREVPVTEIVVGDVVLLLAGDVVPAAVRITSSHLLELDQSVLTGETLPVGKTAVAPGYPRLCFAGTTVVGGTATGVVIGTGSRSYSRNDVH